MSTRNTIAWYGPVAFAGLMLFAGANGLAVWDRLRAEDIVVEGVARLKQSVPADTARVAITAKSVLAGSAKEAAQGIAQKVDAYAAFLRTLPGVSFTNVPLTIEQDVINVGEKFAKSYTAQQRFEIAIKDFTRIQDVITKAVEIEIGDVAETEYLLSEDRAKRSELRQRALEAAKAAATERAAQLGRSLGELSSFSEHTQEFEGSSDLTSDRSTSVTLYQTIETKFTTH